MNLATLIYYLRAHGLPWGTRTHRSNSVADFQEAFTWWDLAVDGVPGQQTLLAFKHAAKFGHRISPNFKISEFRCGCKGKYHTRYAARAHRDLVRALEQARTKLYRGGLPIVSGWRCPKFNAQVGGIKASAHLYGRAADIPAKATPAEFYGLGFHGIGYKGHGNVTHVDVSLALGPDTAFKE